MSSIAIPVRELSMPLSTSRQCTPFSGTPCRKWAAGPCPHATYAMLPNEVLTKRLRRAYVERSILSFSVREAAIEVAERSCIDRDTIARLHPVCKRPDQPRKYDLARLESVALMRHGSRRESN